MADFDPGELPEIGAEEQAEIAEQKKLAAVRLSGREAAVARGRAYGTDEANRRGEVGQARDQRVARAVRYAEWEFAGKPVGNACSRAHLHHTNHGGNPCSVCGFPT